MGRDGNYVCHKKCRTAKDHFQKVVGALDPQDMVFKVVHVYI